MEGLPDGGTCVYARRRRDGDRAENRCLERPVGVAHCASPGRESDPLPGRQLTIVTRPSDVRRRRPASPALSAPIPTGVRMNPNLPHKSATAAEPPKHVIAEYK